MTPELEAALRRAGWYPGRRIDDAHLDLYLRMGVRDFGCHLFPTAIEVLREYGDLLIGNHYFSPENVFLRGDKESWLYWEWQVQEILFPLASELSDQSSSIAISYSGKIYITGCGIMLLGNSIEDFLSSLLVNPEQRLSKWTEFIPSHMNAAIDLEFERIYHAVYGKDYQK